MNQSITSAHEQLFAIAKATRKLSEQAHNEVTTSVNKQHKKPLLFNDIVKTACLPHLAASKANLVRINKSSIHMPQYLWVLNKISLSISDAQAAASSVVEALVRQTDKFELRVRDVEHDDSLASVNLLLKNASSTQTQVGCHLHMVLNNKCSVLSFMTLQDNRAELTLAKTSQEYGVLINDDTFIHLS
ncbi:hypothetical protein [Glaciecola sp. KUL10]|jgi:hypothetical protein|uniref:hypothetical protein n=1 Tax=Glaciecola sp. (strain KUL10) TaxID=2161813 RepID=UPI000D78B8FA|nr:hypothetical protein [Glaciecola sp. KUL10]GBL05409.1 hemolymph proteinase 9 [Glaciecola sp. KUL10]